MDKEALNIRRDETEEISLNHTVNKEEIDDQTIAKLRGDAIGETVYSERFVLTTLLNLSDLEWNSEVEHDLCYLWDMTAERDVCDYLFKLSYPKLACAAILEYDENRFIEIIIGIFANILCADCEKSITRDEIGIVLNVLNTDDPLILIQVMRFLHALFYMYPDQEFLNPSIYNQLKFILESCTNKDLILHTLKIVAILSKELKEDIVKKEFVDSIFTGYEVILENNIVKSNSSNFEDETVQNSTTELLKILCNYSAHNDKANISEIMRIFQNTITILISNLLVYFSFNENLLPVTEQFSYYIEAFTFIYKNLQLHFNRNIFVSLSKILFILLNEEIDDEFENCSELYCYLISRIQDSHQLINDIDKTKVVLEYINKKSFVFDFDYKDNINNLVNEIK